ncbi:hypothetical protein QJS10_CPB14g01638 [Acorus calamus]|uniref:Poly(A) RNA polymerase mitochondrial-like central palm domain-containing protein n=1 Tax=Acorus calamus TaxID=4465 RepID=A0AAV9DB58_ACOCL|nr:hypothetical protein QJS10_CPB14g01638 [Acorus calamus]
MNYSRIPSSSDAEYGELASVIRHILSLIKPNEEDQRRRHQVINAFAAVISSVQSLRGATVNPFGSFVSNLYTRWGDLDISIDLPHLPHVPLVSASKKRKQDILRAIMRALRRNGGIHKLRFVPSARVPLLIFENSYHNISCDISVDNHVGRMKSKILLWISNIDERFRDMILLIKEWAKTHNINDPKSGSFNSYSLCLLVIFHFQMCTPAILPPLKDIFGENLVHALTGMDYNPELYLEGVCTGNISRFISQNRRINQNSLSELFVSFFERFSRLDSLSLDYAISTYTGRWEPLTTKAGWLEKNYAILVEDPFEQPDNAARAVSQTQLAMIFEAISETRRKLSNPAVLRNRNSLLRSMVRNNINSGVGVSTPHRVYNINGSPAIDRFTHTAAAAPTIEEHFQRTFRLGNHRPPVHQQRPGLHYEQGHQTWVPRSSSDRSF